MKDLWKSVLIILVIVLAQPYCFGQKDRKSSNVKRKTKEPPAFVYGSIVGVEGLRHVYIQKLGKIYVGRINRPKTEPFESGAFYFDKVEPGQYYLAGFSIKGGTTFWIPYTKETVKDALFEVSSNNVHFMGSYIVKDVKKGKMGRTGSFDIDRASTPSQTQLSKEIQGYLPAGPWKSKIGRNN